jgi:ABC-2 type transport system permease protein
MSKIFYLMQKEFRQIFREKANLGIIFVMPIIQLLILGFAITTDVKNIATIVVDEDRTVMSRSIVEALRATKTFNFLGMTDSTARAVREMDLANAKLIVVIPRNFEKDLRTGSLPTIQTILDGVDGNSAGITNAYVNIVLTRFQKKWLKEARTLSGRTKALHTVNVLPRMLYNPELSSQNNIIPGIVAVLLTMITLFLTTINIVREKEIGTLEQLSVTPIKNQELIIGKIMPFAILGFMLFNVGLLAGGVIFGIWLKGNLLLLYLMSFIYMMTTLGLGIFISTIAVTQQQAMFFAWFVSIFTMLLSGFFIPIQNMPDFIQGLTYLNPTRYFMEVVRGIVLKGSGISALWPELTGMVIFGTVILSSAILRFHKRLS